MRVRKPHLADSERKDTALLSIRAERKRDANARVLTRLDGKTKNASFVAFHATSMVYFYSERERILLVKKPYAFSGKPTAQ